MAKGESVHDLLSKTFDGGFGERLVLFDEFEEIASRTVLSDSPHVVFGLHVVVEPEDVGVMEFLQNFGLVEYFLLSGLVHALDGYELQLLLPACFKNDGVFAFGLLLVNVIFVHLNYQL